jgi:hypothetical protein
MAESTGRFKFNVNANELGLLASQVVLFVVVAFGAFVIDQRLRLVEVALTPLEHFVQVTPSDIRVAVNELMERNAAMLMENRRLGCAVLRRVGGQDELCPAPAPAQPSRRLHRR